jgi:predicted dehydrogenase
MNPPSSIPGISRRSFVQLMAASGAALAAAKAVTAQTAAPSETINVAIVGVGRQGRILLDNALRIPGLKFTAVCDIWSYSQKIGENLCKKGGHAVKVYDDYKAMLADQKDLQAVIIATPDFWHAPITNDCLAAGLHVYCEKEMANTLQAAQSMVVAARKSGKLLQIGHQRRSNPYYKSAYHTLHNGNFCGNVTTVYAQWHQLKNLRALPPALVAKYAIPAATLAQWGYGSMQEFYEWRWFKKYAGGPMTDLGSHQVDVLNWFLNASPTSVDAIGDTESALAEAKAQAAKGEPVGFVPESFDFTSARYRWDTKWGPVHGTYSVNLTTTYDGFYEVIMGTQGSMRTAEITEKAGMYKEKTADKAVWEDIAQQSGNADGSYKFDPLASRKTVGKMDPEAEKIKANMTKPPHQPHLENFFDAIRGKEKLTCPPEVAYETAVSVIRANESAMTGKKIVFNPAEFKV